MSEVKTYEFSDGAILTYLRDYVCGRVRLDGTIDDAEHVCGFNLGWAKFDLDKTVAEMSMFYEMGNRMPDKTQYAK